MKNYRFELFLLNNFLTAILLLGQGANSVEIKPSSSGERITLEINHHYTDVEVLGYQEKVIRVEMYKGVFGTSIENPPIKFIEDNNRISLTHSNSWTKGYSMKVWLPVNSSLKIDANYASRINVRGIEGDVAIKSHDANVTLDAIIGNVDINSFDGNILVTDLAGSPLIYSNNGNIEITLSKLPASSPNILTSMYGDIQIQLAEHANVSFRFKMEKNFDKVKSDFKLLPMNPQDFPMGTQGAYDYYRRINDGGVPFFVRTFRGKVSISKEQ